MTSEGKGCFVVKGQDLLVWEFSVVLEASLCDHTKDLSPFPTWNMGYGHLFCSFHRDGDGLLLHCQTVPKLVLITTKTFQPCCLFWRLFAWFISKGLYLPLLP